MGDFNACLGAYEKSGHAPPLISYRDFAVMIDDCSLYNLDIIGTLYTWFNGRKGNAIIEERLDRALCSTSSFNSWSQIDCLAFAK